jgi:hypothetical protein
VRFADRSILPRLATVMIAVSVVAAALAACSDNPTVDTSTAPPPSHAPQGSPSPVDHHLINLEFQFCLETDKAVRLEAPLLQGKISKGEAIRRLGQARAIAQEQVTRFANAGYVDLASDMRAWANGFAQGQQMIAKGARPVDAIHPAVHGVSVLFRKIDCQGDA